MTDKKYYTPSIEEFHVGFEFEKKEGFGDGVVKTKDQYNNAKWINQTYIVGTDMYIERMLIGKNSQIGLCGVRVKYLDREDIESLGWSFFGCPLKEDLKTCDYPMVYRILEDRNSFMAQRKVKALLSVIDENTFDLTNEENNKEAKGVILKNKSELKRLMKQLGI